MPFNLYGNNPTIETVNRERQRDAIVIEQLEQGKKPYRDRNRGAIARSAAPSAHDDIQQGDAVGDEYLDATYRYLLVNDPIDGLVWERFSRGSITW